MEKIVTVTNLGVTDRSGAAPSLLIGCGIPRLGASTRTLSL